MDQYLINIVNSLSNEQLMHLLNAMKERLNVFVEIDEMGFCLDVENVNLNGALIQLYCEQIKSQD